jgi:hypothetical protein
MSKEVNNYLLGSGLIFLLITLLHLFRIIFQWEAIFNGKEIPLYFSYIGFIIGAVLTYYAFKLRK